MKKIYEKITKLRELNVFVGITSKDSSRNDSGINNATLAAIHEFGSPANKIPQRSFLRKPLSNNKANLANLAKNLISQVFTEQITIDTALSFIGEEAKNISKEAITNEISPALNSKTIKRKKSSKPLIDTGQLLNAITYEIRK